MNYMSMVKNAPKKSESVMWRSVSNVSRLIEDVRDKAPYLVRSFLMREYELMYGPHFCEELAVEEVARMFHMDGNGSRVDGEIVSMERALTLLPEAQREQYRWDAYVAANGFAHDLARSSLTPDEVLEAARVFWFEDDDFDGGKVFWYYASK